MYDNHVSNFRVLGLREDSISILGGMMPKIQGTIDDIVAPLLLFFAGTDELNKSASTPPEAVNTM